jgi:uncharacterized protein (DUF924 family)
MRSIRRAALTHLPSDYRARRVLDFWFGKLRSASFGAFHQEWFEPDDAYDATIRRRFARS